MAHDIFSEALALHKASQGKIEMHAKTPVTSMHDLARIYSPGVAAVSQLIAQDKEHARTHTFSGRTVAIVSDGSAILGLGNLGPYAALPVMEGKAAIMKSFAGIDAFPLCLDTQDTQEIIRTVQVLAPSFVGIILEDISAPRCFEIEESLKARLDIPVIHDDQHAVAIAVLAGLINSEKVLGHSLRDEPVVVLGAGAAGIATARLLHEAGFSDITLTDSKGIISPLREDLPPYKQELLTWTNKEKRSGDSVEVLRGARIVIGMSVGKTITEEMVQSMKPEAVIFALANPEPEIMPELALRAGVAIIATGRSDYSNQINNALVYPGLYRGLIDAGVRHVDRGLFQVLAEALAGCVPEPTREMIVPDLFHPDLVRRLSETVMRASVS